MLDTLTSKWIEEIDQNPKRLIDVEVIRLEAVKFSILRLIHLTMVSLTDTEREKIENKMIEIFRKLKEPAANYPATFNEIAQSAYAAFLKYYHDNWKTTYPKELVDNNDAGNKFQRPTPTQIKERLIGGAGVVGIMVSMREDDVRLGKDDIKTELMKLA
jgi:hypothetical protein